MDYLKIMKLIKMIIEETDDLEPTWFMAFTCMLIEEWCKKNGADVVEYQENALNAAKSINKALGKY